MLWSGAKLNVMCNNDYPQISTSVRPITEDVMQGPRALTTWVAFSVPVSPVMKETDLLVQVVFYLDKIHVNGVLVSTLTLLILVQIFYFIIPFFSHFFRNKYNQYML